MLAYAMIRLPETASQMKSALDPALAALTEAEGRLREAAGKAAVDGEYDALAVITRWAKTLQSLASEACSVSQTAQQPASLGPSINSPTKRTKTAGKVKPGTPIFTRDSDMLVKTARSQKSKNEYEHRAPGEVVLTVAECLSDWRPNKKLLTGENLLNAYSKKKGSVVSYQLYASLGWFTQIGLVRRHGRSGYSVPQPNTIIRDVQEAWESLRTGQRQ